MTLKLKKLLLGSFTVSQVIYFTERWNAVAAAAAAVVAVTIVAAVAAAGDADAVAAVAAGGVVAAVATVAVVTAVTAVAAVAAGGDDDAVLDGDAVAQNAKKLTHILPHSEVQQLSMGFRVTNSGVWHTWPDH